MGKLLGKIKKIVRKIIIRVVLAVCIVVSILLVLFFSSTARRYMIKILPSKMSHKLLVRYHVIRSFLNFGSASACFKKLAKTEMTFTQVQDKTEASGCTLRNTVQISQSHIPYNNSLLLTCNIALALYAFEKEMVQPLALQHFNQKVTKITHLGTYSCRPVRGSSPGLLSEHAFANAIDIGAFQLADGTTISVQHHWNNSGKKSEFLHDIAEQACQYFHQVLTPNFNDLHRDHFHFDNGFFYQCGY